MPNHIYRKEGPALVWANSADYDGAGGVRTHQIDLTDIIFAEARQGVKADLGEYRAEEYAAIVCVEFKTGEAPESAEVVGLYWGPSISPVAAAANQGGLIGTDADYTGTDGDSLADSLGQLIKIGDLVLTADAVGFPQRQTFVFEPILRYGQPVVYNGTDAEDFNAADTIEMYVRIVPLFNLV